MILPASEIASLKSALTCWEWVGYVSTAIVFLGCVGEFIAEFTPVQKNEERKNWISRLSLIVLIAGIAGELLGEVRVSQLSGQITTNIEERTGEAADRAEKARISAESAADASVRANSYAQKATSSASNALLLAGGARREADSFEQDIVSAKKQAADAESHLADALRQTIQVTEELNRLKTPRSLVNASEFVAVLQKFKGTEYTFSSVFADKESIDLLVEIDSALQQAGWKRVKPPSGFPAISIYGKDADFAVVSSLETGIHLSVDSSESLASLQSLPKDKLPPIVRAAVELGINLSSDIIPSQQGINWINVISGSSTTIRIDIGKKP